MKQKILAVIDTREQRPLTLEAKSGVVIPHERATLATGDYSIKGLEHHVAIERKSLDDLMGCIGRDRERFEREIQRLKAYEVRCVVVESTWLKIESGSYRSKILPTQAIGSIMGWIAQGIPFIMADNHQRAGQFVARMLMITAQRRLKELRSIVDG